MVSKREGETWKQCALRLSDELEKAEQAAEDLRGDIMELEFFNEALQSRTREFEEKSRHATEQAVSQRQERRAIYEQREEARRLAVMIAQDKLGSEGWPAWMKRREYQCGGDGFDAVA